MTQTLSLFSMLRYFQETCQNLQAWCFDTVFLHVPNKHLLLPQLSLFPVNTNKEICNKITLYIKYNSTVHARHIRSIVFESQVEMGRGCGQTHTKTLDKQNKNKNKTTSMYDMWIKKECLFLILKKILMSRDCYFTQHILALLKDFRVQVYRSLNLVSLWWTLLEFYI